MKVQGKQERKTILIVEDQPEVRNTLRECLEGMGFDTLDAADGQAALEKLSACRPDLVCLDVVLPESSGYEICEYMRRSPRHRETPVLMVSGRVLPMDRAYAVEAGADGFLAKPFSAEELRAQVELLLSEEVAPSVEGPVEEGARSERKG